MGDYPVTGYPHVEGYLQQSILVTDHPHGRLTHNRLPSGDYHAMDYPCGRLPCDKLPTWETTL